MGSELLRGPDFSRARERFADHLEGWVSPYQGVNCVVLEGFVDRASR